jgi:asparagine synthase (glutamine-hydrolysing)
MCGIGGMLFRDPTVSMTLADERQAHRGPDDRGAYRDPHNRATLSFRRLAILDLSAAGHQPMSNEDGTVWMVFNGEIYNYRALRAALEARGHVFRSKTDSEVLVHLWEDHGRDMLPLLNGMFAFCIWDERTGEALLARDHAGIKPLYYADVGSAVVFASEPKTLLSIPGVDARVDPISLQQYLTFLWVPGTRTMWSGIRKLSAGGWASWRDGRLECGSWWTWDQTPQRGRDATEWANELRATLLQAVERQLMSDVPLGALVSGGLDSSAIAGAMRAIHPDGPISAYTASSDGGDQDGFVDDLPYARLVAERLGLDLVEERIRPSVASLLPLLVWHTDEPLADPAIAASFLLCRRARQDGTIVLLSGQGADELYHGYRSHRALRIARSVSGVPDPLVRLVGMIAETVSAATGTSARSWPRRATKMLRFLGASGRDRVMQLADWGSPALRREILSPRIADIPADQVYGEYLSLFEQSRGATEEDRWSYVLLKTFLPALNLTYGDRTSMAVSVELRVPYLDRALLEQAGRMPASVKHRDGIPKWVLAEAARPWLPDVIRTRPKTGFGAPLRRWLAVDLRREVHAILGSQRFAARGLFDPAGVRRLLTDLETGRRDVAYIVWALFTFELWAQTFVDRDGSAPIELAA